MVWHQSTRFLHHFIIRKFFRTKYFITTCRKPLQAIQKHLSKSLSFKRWAFQLVTVQTSFEFPLNCLPWSERLPVLVITYLPSISMRSEPSPASSIKECLGHGLLCTISGNTSLLFFNGKQQCVALLQSFIKISFCLKTLNQPSLGTELNLVSIL